MSTQSEFITVKAYLEEGHFFIKIIEICKLRSVKDWRRWTDAYGNELVLDRNKNLHLFKNKLNATITPSDIFFKAYPADIIKMSKWYTVAFAGGLDHSIYFWCMGNDDVLRLCVFIKGDWAENQPPLSMGVPATRKIVELFAESEQDVISTSVGLDEFEISKMWSFKNLNKRIRFSMLAKNADLASIVEEVFNGR